MTGQTSLAGKVAVITGAGSGVGRATAAALANAGMVVGLIGRRRDALEETAAVIEAAGGRTIVAPADIADEAAIQAAIDGILTAYKRIDIAICAAGIGLYGPVEQYSLSDWERTLATNLTGVFLTCRAVLPAMKRTGGAFIAVGSGAGKQGYANLAAYSASKFGLIGFMESLAAEAGEHGIKVSTVIPGSIMTEFGGRALAEKERQRAEGRKFLDAEDVAQAIVSLLTQSDRAWTQELNLWPF